MAFETKKNKKKKTKTNIKKNGKNKMDKRAIEMDEKIKRLDAQILDLKKKMQKSKGAAKNNFKKKALQLLKQKKQYETQRSIFCFFVFCCNHYPTVSQTPKITNKQTNK